MASKSWFCYDRNCRAPLGAIINGELSISPVNNQNISIISTEGAIINVQCAKCGRICRWVPKDSALVEAFMNTHLMKAMVTIVGRLFASGKLQADEPAKEVHYILEEVPKEKEEVTEEKTEE
jgi:hypothetical protein